MIKGKATKIFDGRDGKFYRIPSLILTGKNTLIACADERFFSSADNPNRIEKVIRRSKDFGKTWEDQITAVSTVGETQNKSSAAIDPALLYDSQTNTVFMLYLFTPANVGILNSKKSIGCEKGAFIVRKGMKKYLLKNGELYYKNEPSGVKVSEDGFISANENIYDDSSKYQLEKTSYLMLTSSKDDGLTWTKPVCLNESVKKENSRFIGAGPGCGIQIKNGKYRGRLVFPIYHSWYPLLTHMECLVIYSDDNGQTWTAGKSPSVTGKTSIGNKTFMRLKARTTESQVVELEDGVLKIFMRNHHPQKRIATALSFNGGATWTQVSYNQNLVQPVSQIAAISFEQKGKLMVATLNPAAEIKRVNGTIRLSEDGGETFVHSKPITEDSYPEGYFGYSAIAYLPDDSIGVLFEPNEDFKSLDFVKLSIDYLKQNSN